jgi:SPP1 family predicted phage head-tail adaptor
MKIAHAGVLCRRLTLETPVRTGDEAASATITWTSLGVMWAGIIPLGGREIVVADGQASRVSHSVTLRWRGDVTAAMRFRDGAIIYAIRTVRDSDRRRRLVCMVEEQAP